MAVSTHHDLSGRVALVTGSARGIGLACAQHLGAAGATVVSTDIDEAEGLASLRTIPGPATYAYLDVCDESDWRQVVDRVLAEHGRLDVLVNNAGTTGFELDLGPQDPEHASLDAWHAVHATNLDGVFLGCKHAIRAMRRTQTGSIVNISSRSGLVGIPAAAAYASSKAAIRNHTKTVALYCAEQGLAIRCNSVHPAAILTRMWEPMIGDGPGREQRIDALVRDTPLRRFGTVDEVAAAVLYLASDESAYMTGSELHLDGGILAGSIATIASQGSRTSES